MSNIELKKAMSDRINTMSPEELKQLVEGFLQNLFPDTQQQNDKKSLGAFIEENADQMIEKHRSLLNRLAQ